MAKFNTAGSCSNLITYYFFFFFSHPDPSPHLTSPASKVTKQGRPLSSTHGMIRILRRKSSTFVSSQQIVHSDRDMWAKGRNLSWHLREIFRSTSPTTNLFENCILLTGHVGAGKTTLARGLIREVSSCGDHEDIPSPTFCLDFNYPLENDDNVSSRFPRGIHHLDLYRLQGAEPEDLDALEFSDLTRNAITIIEWPDRLTSRNIVLEGALWIDLQLESQVVDASTSNIIDDKPITEEMFEQWISVPRNVTFKCNSSSLWADRIELL